jgi:hypothetical protein
VVQVTIKEHDFVCSPALSFLLLHIPPIRRRRQTAVLAVGAAGERKNMLNLVSEL